MEAQTEKKPKEKQPVVVVPIEQKLALNVDEAAALGGWKRSHTYHLIKTGKLRARKSGTRTLILRRDLEEYLASAPDMKAGAA